MAALSLQPIRRGISAVVIGVGLVQALAGMASVEGLCKYVRQQGELVERAEQEAQEGQGGEEVSSASEDEPVGGEEARLQEPQPDPRHEVELLWAEVAALRERVEVVEGQAVQGRGGGDINVDVGAVDAGDRGRQRRSVAPPRRVFPEVIAEGGGGAGRRTGLRRGSGAGRRMATGLGGAQVGAAHPSLAAGRTEMAGLGASPDRGIRADPAPGRCALARTTA